MPPVNLPPLYLIVKIVLNDNTLHFFHPYISASPFEAYRVAESFKDDPTVVEIDVLEMVAGREHTSENDNAVMTMWKEKDDWRAEIDPDFKELVELMSTQ